MNFHWLEIFQCSWAFLFVVGVACFFWMGVSFLLFVWSLIEIGSLEGGRQVACMHACQERFCSPIDCGWERRGVVRRFWEGGWSGVHLHGNCDWCIYLAGGICIGSVTRTAEYLCYADVRTFSRLSNSAGLPPIVGIPFINSLSIIKWHHITNYPTRASCVATGELDSFSLAIMIWGLYISRNL